MATDTEEKHQLVLDNKEYNPEKHRAKELGSTDLEKEEKPRSRFAQYFYTKEKERREDQELKQKIRQQERKAYQEERMKLAPEYAREKAQREHKQRLERDSTPLLERFGITPKSSSKESGFAHAGRTLPKGAESFGKGLGSAIPQTQRKGFRKKVGQYSSPLTAEQNIAERIMGGSTSASSRFQNVSVSDMIFGRSGGNAKQHSPTAISDFVLGSPKQKKKGKSFDFSRMI